MSAALRIVGQGIAGSLLAWCALRRGISVEIWETSDHPCASKVAAGIINPITGQRWVKSWRVDELLPVAMGIYRELEDDLGQSFVQRYRLRRLFRDENDRLIATQKVGTGELSPYVISNDEEGLWIEPAFRIDLSVVVSALRQRWEEEGRLRVQAREGALPEFDGVTVWCRGAAELESELFCFASLSLAQGEIISVASPRINPDVILNAGHWLLPFGSGRARVGATYQLRELTRDTAGTGASLPALVSSPESRALLVESAGKFLSSAFEVTAHEVGWRVTTRDKHPVVGRHPQDPGQGICNGLGSKGALLAPYLARQWCDHLESGATFDPAIDVSRFA